jgi:general stress protein 26
MSDDDIDHVWKLMNKISFCMLSTRDGEDIRARPMVAHANKQEHAIYFLTDAEHHKDEEIEHDPNVGIAFADTNNQTYISVSGRAAVSNDRDKIKELWSTPAKAWWENSDDPSIRVLKITPKDAQYWDSHGTEASYVEMLAAAASDRQPYMGDHAKTSL